MFSPDTYNQIAVNMICNILNRGRVLYGKGGMVLRNKDKDGNIIGFAAYKMDLPEGFNESGGTVKMETLYEGIHPDKAAAHYVKAVGVFVALGDAIRWFRENNEGTTIDMKPDILDKN